MATTYDLGPPNRAQIYTTIDATMRICWRRAAQYRPGAAKLSLTSNGGRLAVPGQETNIKNYKLTAGWGMSSYDRL